MIVISYFIMRITLLEFELLKAEIKRLYWKAFLMRKPKIDERFCLWKNYDMQDQQMKLCNSQNHTNFDSQCFLWIDRNESNFCASKQLLYFLKIVSGILKPALLLALVISGGDIENLRDSKSWRRLQPIMGNYWWSLANRATAKTVKTTDVVLYRKVTITREKSLVKIY